MQKGYTNKLESQTQELKRLVTSKQAQITYLEEKVGNMKKKYAVSAIIHIDRHRSSSIVIVDENETTTGKRKELT